MDDHASLEDGPSAVQQGAELSLWEEPSQHFFSGSRTEPPVGTKTFNLIKTCVLIICIFFQYSLEYVPAVRTDS